MAFFTQKDSSPDIATQPTTSTSMGSTLGTARISRAVITYMMPQLMTAATVLEYIISAAVWNTTSKPL